MGIVNSDAFYRYLSFPVEVRAIVGLKMRGQIQHIFKAVTSTCFIVPYFTFYTGNVDHSG